MAGKGIWIRTIHFSRVVFITIAIGLLTIPFTVGVVLLLVFTILPFYILRTLVALVGRLTDPDLRKILTGLSANLIRDLDVQHLKSRNTLVACFRFNGPLKYDLVEKEFLKRVIHKMDESSNSQQLFYPELRQYFTSCLGYPFLKVDRDFDFKNHITLVNPSSEAVNESELVKVWERLLIKPFPKGKSAWEVVIVDNVIPNDEDLHTWTATTSDSSIVSDHYWVAFLRIHHALADGFSIQKMVAILADDEYSPSFSTKVTSCQQLLLNLRAVLFGTYDTLNRVLRFNEGYHTLHVPAKHHSQECFIVQSGLIPMEKVRLAKKAFGATYTTILLAAVSGGVRQFLLQNSRPLPKFMSTAVPIPTKGHSDKFSNNFSLATVGLAVNCEDSQRRVLYIQEQLQLLKSTAWILALDFITNCMGCYPTRMIRWLTKKSLFSSTYSTQPGPPRCLHAFGCKLLEVNFAFGTSTDSFGLGLSSLSYNDHFRIVLGIERNLVSTREKSEELVQCIVNEFHVLEKYHNGIKDTKC